MSLIAKAEGLTVSLTDGRTLKYPDFTIEKGDRILLRGPSGRGKTLLFRLLAGLEKPHQGILEIRTQKIGYAFQDARLIPQLSALENLTLVDGVNAAAATQAMCRVGLQDVLNQKCALLSGGEARRVNLLRALCSDPELLLLYEVGAGLDQDTWAKTRDVCQEFFATRCTGIMEIVHAPMKPMSGCNSRFVLDL